MDNPDAPDKNERQASRRALAPGLSWMRSKTNAVEWPFHRGGTAIRSDRRNRPTRVRGLTPPGSPILSGASRVPILHSGVLLQPEPVSIDTQIHPAEA